MRSGGIDLCDASEQSPSGEPCPRPSVPSRRHEIVLRRLLRLALSEVFLARNDARQERLRPPVATRDRGLPGSDHRGMAEPTARLSCWAGGAMRRLHARVALVAVVGLLSGSLTHAMRLCAIAQHDIGARRGACANHRAPHDASHPAQWPAGRSADGTPPCCSPVVAVAGVSNSRVERDLTALDGPSRVPLPVAWLDPPLARPDDARIGQRSLGSPPGRFRGRRDHLALGILIV